MTKTTWSLKNIAKSKAFDFTNEFANNNTITNIIAFEVETDTDKEGGCYFDSFEKAWDYLSETLIKQTNIDYFNCEDFKKTNFIQLNCFNKNTDESIKLINFLRLNDRKFRRGRKVCFL